MGILLVILVPTITFLFSEGNWWERGRVAGWSLVGVVVGLVTIFGVAYLNTDFLIIIIEATILSLLL